MIARIHANSYYKFIYIWTIFNVLVALGKLF